MQFLFVIGISFPGVSNTSVPDTVGQREISLSKLQELQGQEEYQEIVNYQKKAPSKSNWLSKIFRKYLDIIFGNRIASSFFKVIPYIILIIAFVLIILKIANIELGGFMYTNKKNIEDDSFSLEIEDIQDIPIRKLLRNAEDENNYRLMIRYAYLLILKDLHQKRLINWEIHKSNYDYLFETRSLGIKDDFRRITHHYESIWYGDIKIDPEYGSAIYKEMLSFENQLSHHKS